MSSVGTYLRDLRQRKGVSLEEVARTTRVAQRYLESLEADAFDALPSPVFTRGFIRAYCQALSELPDEALAAYESREITATPSPAAGARPGAPAARPIVAAGRPRPAASSRTGAASRTTDAEPRGRGAVLVSFVLLVVLGVALFAVALVIHPRDRAERVAVSEPPPESRAVRAPSGEPVVSVPRAGSPAAPPPTGAPTASGVPAPAAPRPSPAVATAPPSAAVPTAAAPAPATPTAPGATGPRPPTPTAPSLTAAAPAPAAPAVAGAPAPAVPRPAPPAAATTPPPPGAPVTPSAAVAPGVPPVAAARQASPAPAAVPPAGPAPAAPALDVAVGAISSPYRLVARTNETTWIRVRTEDGRTSEENVPAGEVREWISNRPFTLTVGNAGGVTLELNGRTLPPLGPKGVVIQRIILPPEAR